LDTKQIFSQKAKGWYLYIGGFGLIELVVDTHSQRELVLKRCNIDRPEVREIVQKEINILQRFKGPYVVNLLGHDVNQKRTGTEALLLMEYYPGGHLLDRLNQRHGSLLPIQSVYTIFGQLLQSVNALHTSRPPIIHRDLKLENILIGPVCYYFSRNTIPLSQSLLFHLGWESETLRFWLMS
jgi:AP2-associated kinase